MLSLRRSLTVLALSALATSAWSQVAVQTQGSAPPHDPIGRIEPRAGDAGYAVCFGDGSGTMCPVRNFGAPGHGCENSMGMGGGLLWANGIAQISQDTVAFQVENLPQRSIVLFLQATGSRNRELGLPFGDGLMCLGGSVMNLGAVESVGGIAVFPTHMLPPCFASLSAIGRVPIRGGERYYQALYRDHADFGTTSTFNLSNAWAIEWIP